MKKALLVNFILLFSVNLYSQGFATEHLRAGAGISYASGINTIGITLNGSYNITGRWEGAISFNHINEKNSITWNLLDFDGHYVFYNNNNRLTVYGLTGLSFTMWKLNVPDMTIMGYTVPGYTSTGSNAGMNLGAGLNYRLADNLNLEPELRYTFISGSYLRIGATLQLVF
ncbi:MAG TPA: outer membrane beta-barrel protein [Bacteroidales bacterium]|nr:outer membrane beta-barrel protein [Bacteroidales bacterium]